MSRQNAGASFQATATHATSAVATLTGVAGVTAYITDIAGSSDKAGSLLLVKDGSTVIFQVQLGSNAFGYSFITPLRVTMGTDVSITVDGTSACYSNIAGFTL